MVKFITDLQPAGKYTVMLKIHYVMLYLHQYLLYINSKLFLHMKHIYLDYSFYYPVHLIDLIFKYSKNRYS